MRCIQAKVRDFNASQLFDVSFLTTMFLLSILRLPRIGINFITSAQYATVSKASVTKVGKVRKGTSNKVVIPVEKDCNKLITHVCGLNYFKEGEDVKLKSDDEYPEWLWNLRTEPFKLSDLDPNTKTYWRYIRKQAIIKKNKMIKHRKL